MTNMYCIILQYNTKSLECIGIGWFFITQKYQYQTFEMWVCTHVLQKNSTLADGGMFEPFKCVQKFLSSEDVQFFFPCSLYCVAHSFRKNFACFEEHNQEFSLSFSHFYSSIPKSIVFHWHITFVNIKRRKTSVSLTLIVYLFVNV